MQICKLCVIRTKLEKILQAVDDLPTMENDFFDDSVAEVLNSIEDAIGIHKCMCEDFRQAERRPGVFPDADALRSTR